MTDIVEIGAAEAMQRAEIDVQVATAKRYPRDPQRALQRAKSEALSTVERAESCFYLLPKGKEPIPGPSVHLARIVAQQWGNLRVAARTINDTGKMIIAQAVAHDLETNYACSIEKPRRLTDKRGQRYSDDVVVSTTSAALAIAYRDAVFAVVPRTVWESIYLDCRAKVAGDIRPEELEKRRASAVTSFRSKGATDAQICEIAGVESVAHIGKEELTNLRFFWKSIQDGTQTIDGLLQMRAEDRGEFTTSADAAENTTSLGDATRAAVPTGGTNVPAKETNRKPHPLAVQACDLYEQVKDAIGENADTVLKDCGFNHLAHLRGNKDESRLNAVIAALTAALPQKDAAQTPRSD